MSDLINLDNPKANQVLVYSEISGKFINVEPTLSLFNYEEPQYNVSNSGNGEGLLVKFNGRTLLSKSLKVGDGLSLKATNDTITIENISENAKTLEGKSANEFILKENKLSDVDIEPLKVRLNYYEKQQAHDIFMETNASNIPDVDNEYDIGSNGRRYADVYAYTFHGTATEALISKEYQQYGARKDQVLTWTEEGWRPRSVAGTILNSFYVDDLLDIELDDELSNNSILMFDKNSETWKSKNFDQIQKAMSVDVDEKLEDYVTIENFDETIKDYAKEEQLDLYLLKQGLQVLPQYGERVARPTDGAIDTSEANIHVITLKQETEITLTAPDDGKMYPLTIIISGADQYKPIWPETLRWLGGEEPEYEGNDIVTVFTVDGVNWVASFIGSY